MSQAPVAASPSALKSSSNNLRASSSSSQQVFSSATNKTQTQNNQQNHGGSGGGGGSIKSGNSIVVDCTASNQAANSNNSGSSPGVVERASKEISRRIHSLGFKARTAAAKNSAVTAFQPGNNPGSTNNSASAAFAGVSPTEADKLNGNDVPQNPTSPSTIPASTSSSQSMGSRMGTIIKGSVMDKVTHVFSGGSLTNNSSSSSSNNSSNSNISKNSTKMGNSNSNNSHKDSSNQVSESSQSKDSPGSATDINGIPRGAVANGRAKFESKPSNSSAISSPTSSSSSTPDKPIRFFGSRSRTGSPILPVKTPKVPTTGSPSSSVVETSPSALVSSSPPNQHGITATAADPKVEMSVSQASKPEEGERKSETVSIPNPLGGSSTASQPLTQPQAGTIVKITTSDVKKPMNNASSSSVNNGFKSFGQGVSPSPAGAAATASSLISPPGTSTSKQTVSSSSTTKKLSPDATTVGSKSSLSSTSVKSPTQSETAVSPNSNTKLFTKMKRFLLWNELWEDEKFLSWFFRYFPLQDRYSLAQVCRKWKRVIYQPLFWTDIRPVLHCRTLRTWTDNEPEKKELKKTYYASLVERNFETMVLLNANDADVFDFIQNFPHGQQHLVGLSLRCCNLSDRGLEALLEFLQSLYQLDICGCNEITEQGLWSSLHPRLVSVTINDCINVADECICAVTQLLPSLYEFNLQAYHVTDSALSYFSPKQTGTLNVLRLQSCWEITNHGIVNIVHTLPNLTVLSLSGCSKITDDGIELIAENLRKLRSLDVSWCPRVTDAALEYIACDLNHLEELTLDRCIHITDIGIGYISTMLNLNTLFLRWCTQIRDFGLQHICGMRSMQVLSLAGCSLLTSSGLSNLIQLRHLVELELTNCPGASTELIEYLRQNLPNALVLD